MFSIFYIIVFKERKKYSSEEIDEIELKKDFLNQKKQI
jgi:hypothetical protein